MMNYYPINVLKDIIGSLKKLSDKKVLSYGETLIVTESITLLILICEIAVNSPMYTYLKADSFNKLENT